MAETPDFDAFLADPCGVWAEHAPSITDDQAVQAARSSRAFREQLKGQISASVEATGSFRDADRPARILVQVFDAQDIAELFRELAAVRPPQDWAAEYGRRFARSTPPLADKS